MISQGKYPPRKTHPKDIDVTNEIKQDTTDISVYFNLTNNTAYYKPTTAPIPLNVIVITSNEDYECYMTLVNWRVPVRSEANLDAFFQQYNSSMGCGDFGNRVANQPVRYYYSQQMEDLFSNPIDQNVSNMLIIADNTNQLQNLKAFILNGTSANAVYNYNTMFLSFSLQVVYKLNDRWFITTVTFACLDFLALCAAVAIFAKFKNSKKKLREFRERREKWYKYDLDYVR
jgi:hypothetical protein